MPIDSIMEFSLHSPSMGQDSKKIDEKKLKQACMDFESVFIHQMLKSMRQTVPKTGLFREGPEKDIFQSLFDQELSRSLAHQGGLGLGKIMYQQMMKHGRIKLSDSTEESLANKDDQRSVRSE